MSTRKILTATLLAIGGAGVVVGAGSANATVGPECVGDTHATACIWVDPAGVPSYDPTGGSGIHDCVYAGPPPCKPVDLPTPSGGSYDPWIVRVSVGGDAVAEHTYDIGIPEFQPGAAAR